MRGSLVLIIGGNKAAHCELSSIIARFMLMSKVEAPRQSSGESYKLCEQHPNKQKFHFVSAASIAFICWNYSKVVEGVFMLCNKVSLKIRNQGSSFCNSLPKDIGEDIRRKGDFCYQWKLYKSKYSKKWAFESISQGKVYRGRGVGISTPNNNESYIKIFQKTTIRDFHKYLYLLNSVSSRTACTESFSKCASTHRKVLPLGKKRTIWR